MEVTTVTKLIGVYDADGTIVGEIKYVVGKLLGRTHCALCDLTHGTKVKGRDDFRECAAALPVPFDLFHRNDQPDEVRAHTTGNLPCVIAVSSDGSMSLALTAKQLDACEGRIDRLETLLQSVIDR